MISKRVLEKLYRRYNRRKYVHPDPLEFLYGYPDVRDREIAGFIASILAYGRVAQILKSVGTVLDKMGPSPYAFLKEKSTSSLAAIFLGFRHRFTADTGLVSVLTSMKKVISRYGSLNRCFVAGMRDSDETVLPALQKFSTELMCNDSYLVPSPERGSACKRLNLFLRWMVRKDAVDPGGWMGVPASKLIMPLDVHIAKIGCELRLTKRKSPGMGMALDITASFQELTPEDPVKYDFVLTRFGIRDDLHMDTLLRPFCSRLQG